MLPRVYIETTIPSYLTARPNRDLLRTAQQQLTRDWWDFERGRFEVVVSQLVKDECGRGDPTAAAARLAALVGIPILRATADTGALADALTAGVPIPPRAVADATHIATAAVYAVRYLLTWNCRHIANAVFRPQIESICRDHGYEPPIICTPAELMGEGYDAGG